MLYSKEIPITCLPILDQQQVRTQFDESHTPLFSNSKGEAGIPVIQIEQKNDKSL